MKEKRTKLASTPCSVLEVRLDGKLHDLVFDEPEHAIKNAILEYPALEEVRVVENPNGYKFNWIEDIIFSPNVKLNRRSSEDGTT